MAAITPTPPADVINLGVERRKRSQTTNRRPVPSMEMALLLTLLVLLPAKKRRKFSASLQDWIAARPDDVSVLAAQKAVEALWGEG